MRSLKVDVYRVARDDLVSSQDLVALSSIHLLADSRAPRGFHQPPPRSYLVEVRSPPIPHAIVEQATEAALLVKKSLIDLVALSRVDA